MSSGFLAVNKNNQVLVSSETRNLHFVGKASLTGVLGSRNNYGGMRYWSFRINCNVTPVPFFSMPAGGFSAIAAIRRVSAGVWDIEVIRSGVSGTAPEVYVFADPRGISSAGLSSYGMQVMHNDGTPSFDSRLSPLAVTGGALVAQPGSPINPAWEIRPYYDSIIGTQDYNYYSGGTQINVSSWYDSDANAHYTSLYADKGTGDASFVLAPTNYNSNALAAGSGNTKPIFYYPSLSQAIRVVSGVYRIGSTYRCNSNYWVLYRGGISFSAGTLQTGWISAVVGSYWKAARKDSGTTIGSGIDASSIVSAGAGGTPPYFNESLNLQSTAVIVGNGSWYD